MNLTILLFFLQLPLASWGAKSKWSEYYDKLFTPQVSITLTLVVCLIVIWVIGALFDNWFKTRKFLLAVIKTAIIGIVLFSILKAYPTGKGGENGGGGSEPIDGPPPVDGGPSGNEGTLPPAPKKRKGINITITYSEDGARIDKKDSPLKDHKEIFNKLKSCLKDDEHCFGTITIVFDKGISTNTDELKKLLRNYHNLQNNATEIKIDDSSVNTSNGDKK